MPAPTTGYVTNLLVRVGTYVHVGQQLFALVESETWWISANFMETYLRRVRVGQPARITIDMYPGRLFTGVVEGISAGIYQVDGETAGYGLPIVRQTIDWVRLAQRFPVRVTITDLDHALSAALRRQRRGDDRHGRPVTRCRQKDFTAWRRVDAARPLAP